MLLLSPFLPSLLLALLLFPSVLSADAVQWRSRSIYQLITDRFALEDGEPSVCNPADQTWCGGTWKSLEQNLDYIQQAGFTAVWISPASENWLGPRTPYGDPYHGYWVQDVSKLNSHFGTSDSLKSLSNALHSRGMFLMVDIVANNVMATSVTPDYSDYFFKDASMYHSYCPIHFGNRTSETLCWLGDTVVTLPDIDTTNQQVISRYQKWIKEFVETYEIDGLRIDAAKHVNSDFWQGFCGAAGVFCMGEVFGNDVNEAASYQGVLDSVLNYPIYDALVQAFSIPGPKNMSGLLAVQQLSATTYKDPTVLGNFIENQDNPRWANLSVDPQSMYNAMIWNFMSDGIPIVYYGQEQRFHGASDPFNREPLWTSGYSKTPAYQLIAQINAFRNHMVNTTDWATQKMQVITQSDKEIAFIKGNVITVLTNIGSPPANESVTVFTPWAQMSSATDILTCQKFVIGSNNTLHFQYAQGGRPVIFVPTADLDGSGFCGTELASNPSSRSNQASASDALNFAYIPYRLVFWLFGLITLSCYV